MRQHAQTTDTIKWIGSEYKYAGIVGATGILACYFKTCSIVLTAKIIGGGEGEGGNYEREPTKYLQASWAKL